MAVHFPCCHFSRFTGGIVMAVLGVMFLMAAFLAMCCAFQMGCLRRAVEAHNTQQQPQTQAYVHQVSHPIPSWTHGDRGNSSKPESVE